MKITETLKTIITEQTRLDLLVDKLTKPIGENEPLLSVEELIKIVVGDPKTIISGEISDEPTENDLTKIKKVGPYSQWLIKQYVKGRDKKDGSSDFSRLFFEDLYKVTEDLKKFDRFKQRIPEEQRDIDKLTIDQLYKLTKDFSLEKTKATAAEKEKAKSTYEHPGADIDYKSNNWTVVRISDQSKLGKDAACFYGGNNKETRWCTSAPGLNYFDQYIKQGPLYVILPNSGPAASSGLPKERYQFHFESDQFMDIDDRQVNLVEIFNDKLSELKDYFKKIFMNYLNTSAGLDIEVKDNDTNSKFIGIYGFDDFFKILPKKINRLFITLNTTVGYEISDIIGEFKDLTILAINGGVSEVSSRIGECKNLIFITLNNSPNLKTIPMSIFKLPNLSTLSLANSKNVKVPDKIESYGFIEVGDKIFANKKVFK